MIARFSPVGDENSFGRARRFFLFFFKGTTDCKWKKKKSRKQIAKTSALELQTRVETIISK